MKAKRVGKSLACPVADCGKIFAWGTTLRRHMIVHLERPPLECSFCRKRFNLEQHLREHESSHSGKMLYVCRVGGCEREFYQASMLARHRKEHPEYKIKKYNYTRNQKRSQQTTPNTKIVGLSLDIISRVTCSRPSKRMKIEGGVDNAVMVDNAMIVGNAAMDNAVNNAINPIDPIDPIINPIDPIDPIIDPIDPIINPIDHPKHPLFKMPEARESPCDGREDGREKGDLRNIGSSSYIPPECVPHFPRMDYMQPYLPPIGSQQIPMRRYLVQMVVEEPLGTRAQRATFTSANGGTQGTSSLFPQALPSMFPPQLLPLTAPQLYPHPLPTPHYPQFIYSYPTSTYPAALNAQWSPS